MENSSKIGVILTVILVLFFIVGGYLLTYKIPDDQILPSKNTSYTDSEGDWVKENSQGISDNDIFSRKVRLPDGSFENQLINISSYRTELSPEEWVVTQIDLNDVLVMTHEWGVLNEYKHLSITSRTVNDDAQIDYFFKNNDVISFIFQPLHALKESDNKDYYLKIINEYLSN